MKESVRQGKEQRKATLHLSKIGTVKVVLHRAMEGPIKTCAIKREIDQWYVIFICEVQGEVLPVSSEQVGIDLGVTHLAALSDGTFIDHPRYFRGAQKKLVATQRAKDRRKKGSHRQRKAQRQIAKCHRKIRNQRRDFLHKQSRKLVNRFQMIVFEDLPIANLVRAPKPKQDEATGKYLPNGASAKAGLNKSILDAGWGMFMEMIIVKAASAGRTVLFVDPARTSQTCPNCGTIRKKTLEERWHSCVCGCELDRDTASAKVILDVGRKHFSVGTRPTSATA